MPMGKGVAGTDFQVLLERCRARFGLERDTTDEIPRTILGRMKIGTFIVTPQPFAHIIRQPNVRLTGSRETSQEIDVMHETSLVRLAIRSSEWESTGRPYSAQRFALLAT